MASANVIEFTDANFETEVLKADKPTLVDALADEYKGRFRFGKMDVDHQQIVPTQYGIRSIPTLLIFKGGKVVAQLVGTQSRSKLEAELQKHL